MKNPPAWFWRAFRPTLASGSRLIRGMSFSRRMSPWCSATPLPLAAFFLPCGAFAVEVSKKFQAFVFKNYEVLMAICATVLLRIFGPSSGDSNLFRLSGIPVDERIISEKQYRAGTLSGRTMKGPRDKSCSVALRGTPESWTAANIRSAAETDRIACSKLQRVVQG